MAFTEGEDEGCEPHAPSPHTTTLRCTGLPLPNDGLADEEPHKGMKNGMVGWVCGKRGAEGTA
jgi:hypothetical protein